MTDLISAQIQIMFDTLSSSTEHIEPAGCARRQSRRPPARMHCRMCRPRLSPFRVSMQAPDSASAHLKFASIKED
jgi:hypothetical protein